MKLNVPYYSQFLDIDDSFWMLRACGAVSLAMVAEYEGIVLPDILAFCHEARERGGYHVVNGWVHDYVVLKARELDLLAYRQEGLTGVTEIISALNAGHPVIVSVEKRVPVHGTLWVVGPGERAGVASPSRMRRAHPARTPS